LKAQGGTKTATKNLGGGRGPKGGTGERVPSKSPKKRGE